MEEPKYAEVRATFRAAPARFSARIGTVGPKPPWRRRLRDLSWKVAEKSLSRPEVQDFLIEKSKKFIEWTETILASLQRRRQPAEAEQV